MIGQTAARPPSPTLRPRSARARRVAAIVLPLVVLLAAAGPVAAISGIAWPVQNLGDRGSDVLAIQRLLRARLATLPPPAPEDPAPTVPPADGLFRTSTDQAVRELQAARGLSVTGIVDGPTWGALIRTLDRGDEGEAVLALQMQLVEKRRAAIQVDGIFGLATESAVKSLQRHFGLTQTGVVNTSTWRALVWHFELPRFSSAGLCDYSVGNGAANWGTAETIGVLEAVGRTTVALGYGRVAVGDISFEHGGDIPGHVSHERGLDVDVRPMRRANDQCTWGSRWTFSTYDRTATRTLIKKFRALAPGHIKLIYFNDPVLIEEGLTRWYSGHDDHIHVRFCEKWHPVAAYDC